MDAALKLSPEELQREMGVSHGSILKTLGHIHFADRIWFSRVVDPAIEVHRSSDLPLLESDWPAIQRRWEEWADALTDADVTRPVSYKSMFGGTAETPVWQIVLHVVNHATLHRGQVVGMLRQLGAQPPATDLMFYYREQAAATSGA